MSREIQYSNTNLVNRPDRLYERIVLEPRFFLESLVEITDKERRTIPFILNPPQSRYYNSRTLRDIILKPRQLGFCCHPDTLILTADLKWIPIKDIQIGQEVIATDEFPSGEFGLSTGEKRRYPRKFRTATVEEKSSVFETAYKLKMDDGRELIFTGEHRMLSRLRKGNKGVPLKYGKGDGCGPATFWRKVKDFRIGDEIQWITKPWEKGNNEDGWFGGIIDGEGGLGHLKGRSCDIGACQTVGPIFDRMEKYVKEKGYHYRIEVYKQGKVGDPTPTGPRQKPGKLVKNVKVGRINELFQIIGQTRPTKAIGVHWWEGHKFPKRSWSKVISIEQLLTQEMIDLQTSTKTYVAEGFVSHNSTEIMGLFLHDTMFVPNTVSVIVAHTDKDASDLFERARFMFNSIPNTFKPNVGRSNIRELFFDRVNSRFFIGSAEARHFGISKTITNLHITEASHPYYKEDFLIGIMESVPRSGRIVLESTARGEGNIYHVYYMDAKEKHNEFKIHYYRWFEHSEYQIALLPGEKLSLDEEERELIRKFRLTLPQIKWRREKKGRLGKKFIQEYPELEDDEAFIKSGSPVFDGDWLKARDRELLEQNPQEIWLGGDLFIYKIAEGGARYVVGCLPDGEKVITDSGYKDIEKVTLEDRLIGKDGATKKIFNTQRRYYKGEIVGVRPHYTTESTYLTPEHPILVLKDSKVYCNYVRSGKKYKRVTQIYSEEMTTKKVGELSVSDILVFPIRYTEVLSNKEILGHFPDQSRIRIDRRVDKSIILKEDFWFFIGLWLAEGWINKNKNNLKGIFIELGSNETVLREKTSHIIKKLFRRRGALRPTKKTVGTISFGSEAIHMFIKENFGQGAYGKYFAEWIKYLPRKLKLRLFEGYFRGDGHLEECKNGRYKISCTSKSKKMIKDFQEVLLSLGFLCSFAHRESKPWYKTFGTWSEKNKHSYQLGVSERETHQILKELGSYENYISIGFKRKRHTQFGFIKGGYLHTRIKDLKSKEYDGYVNNFEVEDHFYCCPLLTVHNCDTSEGDINSDFSAASVIKCFPLPIEQVALLVGRWTPDIFSEKVYKMGLAYNKAIIGVERNNHGHAVLLNLSNGIVRAGAVRYPPYPEIYAGMDRKLGWLTSGLTKPIMIEELDRAMRSGQLIVNSKRFISEARKFQYAGANKMGAPSGGHDDVVMANAVAIMVISSGGFDWSFT